MPRKIQEPLKEKYHSDDYYIEIGIDEAGRGPLFGRVYTAAVILPKTNFDFSKMKDSKKFSSEKKIQQVAEYIKENAVAWAVSYNDEKTIDKINIRQSVLDSMHKSIKNILQGRKEEDNENYFLLVDGNDFKPYITIKNGAFIPLPYKCIESGDDTYCAIAAASILAKVERDKYIKELCEENSILKENYGIDKNKGYGTKQHLEGIKNNGITKWHRKTYGICKDFS